MPKKNAAPKLTPMLTLMRHSLYMADRTGLFGASMRLSKGSLCSFKFVPDKFIEPFEPRLSLTFRIMRSDRVM